MKTLDPADFAAAVESRLVGHQVNRRPRDLAQLFLFTFGSDPRQQALRYTLQKALLRATVEHARKACRYYHRPAYDAWIDTPPGEPLDLSCWPLLERGQVIENFDDLIADDVAFSFSCHTSGTTGPALSVYKSIEEIDFIQQYYTSLFEPVSRNLARLPLILSFPNLYHGVGLPMPALGRVFASGVTDDTLIQDARKVLLTTYNIPGHEERISIVSGLSFHVQFFTSYLLEQGEDLPKLKIRSLNLTGGYVSRLVRRFVAESWDAAVTDRYSLTEVLGGATRCAMCDCFHLDPHVIGEVLDVDSHQVIEEGIGLLALTSLYPFVQQLPLLRYNTGDVVRLVRSECQPGTTFEFLGKSKNCVRRTDGGRSQWLLFSVDLFEVLNEIPDVSVYEWFSNVRVVHDRTVGARQIYCASATDSPDGEKTDILLEIELRYAPHCFPDRVSELRRMIVDRLRQARSSLARLMDEGRAGLRIDFKSPGALGDRFVIKT